MIDDLLDVARIMSGKLRLEQTVVDFRGVIREALQAVQPLAAAKRLERRMLASPDLIQRPVAARLAGAGAVAALVVPPVALVAAASVTGADC